MTKFLLNNQTIETDLPGGTTVLDFVRYQMNLKGTKIGCREGDCGACTVMVGELRDGGVRYRTMTSCLMPIANAGKHIVTIEGINREDGNTDAGLNRRWLMSQALNACRSWFYCFDDRFCDRGRAANTRSGISAVDGNICRCTGYKSIERACERISGIPAENSKPEYFTDIAQRLTELTDMRKQMCVSNGESETRFVAGGTDLYVQKHEEMSSSNASSLFYCHHLNFIREDESAIELGASVVVTDLLESDIFKRAFPDLRKHIKLVSSTPIRNMATIGGNIVNVSPFVILLGCWPWTLKLI